MAPAVVSQLPAGTVTFLFTDVEGSTTLLQRAPRAYETAITRHHEIIRRAVESSTGHVFETIGDAAYAAFARAQDAAVAAVEAQKALAAEPWAETPIRVRMAIHSGDVSLQGDHYFGPALYRAARLMSTAHGGQVVVSSASAAMLEERSPEGLELLDLGPHRLKDIPGAEHVHQLAGAGLAREFPPLRSIGAHPNNLPVLPTRLVGRERELQRVRELLLAPATRLLTLTGPGGSGKTRLALELAGESLESFPDGVFYVPLARVQDPDLVANAVAQAIGLREVPGKPLEETLRGHLRDHRILLVLDNFEHLLPAATFVSDLLASAPDIRMLVTSQAALRLYGEREFDVAPLSVKATVDTAHPEVAHATLLFLERAREIRADLRVTADDLAAISQICARLDGLPLAIELAAARIRLLAPRDLLARLERQLPLLAGGARDLPERQRTLRGAIEWSHGLLDESERAIFRRFAVLNGPCGVADVEAVLATGGATSGVEILDGLGSLAEKSLLRRDGDRLGILAAIREFASERLAAAGEADALGRRHAEHFCRIAEEMDPLLRGSRQMSALERFDEVADQLRGGLAWATQHDPALAVRLASASGWYWFMRAQRTEAIHWFRSVLPIPHGSPANAAARVLAFASHMTSDIGDRSEALRLSRQIDMFIPAMTDPHDRALVTLWRTYAEINEDPRMALAVARGTTRELTAGVDRWIDAFYGLMVGELARLVGDEDLALACNERARDAAREVGDRFQLAIIQVNVSHIYLRRGRIDEAAAGLEEAIAWLKVFGIRWALGFSLTGLAGVAMARGDPRRAVRLLASTNAWFEQSGIVMEPQDRAEYDRYLAAARAALSPQEFTALWEAGSSASLEDAAAQAGGRDQRAAGSVAS